MHESDNFYHSSDNYGDRVTRVRYRRQQTFVERIQESCTNILIGVVLVVISIALIIWNEGREVKTSRSLSEGLEKVISLSESEYLNPSLNGKLIHIVGPVFAEPLLFDNEFHVSVRAVKLRRVVEMFQWVEHQSTSTEDVGGGETREETTYSYSQEWVDHLVDSRGFSSSHSNPSSLAISPQLYSASSVKLSNKYILSQGLIDQISDFTTIELNHDVSGYIRLDNWFYRSFNPHYPQIGDMRIRFEAAGLPVYQGKSQTVSIIAEQRNENLLISHSTNYGDEIEMLYLGSFTAKYMFEKAKFENSLITWGLRFVAWFIMFLGFCAMTSIITTLVSWLPIVRELVGLSVGLMNFSLASSLSLVVIACAWIFYRPVLGFTLFFLSCLPFIMQKVRGSRVSHREHFS